MAFAKHRSTEGESSAESYNIHEITLPLSISKHVVAAGRRFHAEIQQEVEG